MNETEFKKLFAQYKPTERTSIFSIQGQTWDDQIDEWSKYVNAINGNNGVLPIDLWVKTPGGTASSTSLANPPRSYLPYFLEKGEKNFGHAKPAKNNLGNMICFYENLGKKPQYTKYENTYYDEYETNKKYDETRSSITQPLLDHYNQYINPLIRGLVQAQSLNDIKQIEESPEYQRFIGKQLLRKIAVLMSLVPGSNFPNAFMWIYAEDKVAKIGRLIGEDYDDQESFLTNNNRIYEKAKKWAGITLSSAQIDYIKLYDFLWFLTIDTSELTDFSNPNIIYNGAPGTGKTYGVNTAIEKLKAMDPDFYPDSRFIQFHPSYTYQDFIEGIKPIGFNQSGSLDLQVVNGSFKQFCIDVKTNNEKEWKTLGDPKDPKNIEKWPHYFYVVDEINRGNLSGIFGEIFTLLEPEYRDYDFSGTYKNRGANLVSTALSSVIKEISKTDPKKGGDLTYKNIGGEVLFGIPFNIHFIGMMNDVDRSIDAFDLALRRRFKWINKKFEPDVIRDAFVVARYKTGIDEYVADCERLNDFICKKENGVGLGLGESYAFGHAFFLKYLSTGTKRQINKQRKNEVFSNFIEGTLREYLRQTSDESTIEDSVKQAKKAFGLD